MADHVRHRLYASLADAQSSANEVELLNIQHQPSVSSIHDSTSTVGNGTHYEASLRTPSPLPQSATGSGAHAPTRTDQPEDSREYVSPPNPEPYSSPKQPHVPIPQPQYHVFRRWQWELISMVLAIGLLIAIVVLISQYDGRSLDEWRFPVNLSTLLALIATVFRIVLVVPVTSFLSECKWDWVGRDQVRFLSDMQALDEASRGPWGAIGILPMAVRGNMPALVAAVTSVAALATAPFVQQALQVVECKRPAARSGAVLPYAHFVPRSGGYTLNTGAPAPGDENANIRATYDTELMVQSCQARPDAPDNQITPTCTTGNCTFPNGDPGENGAVSHSTIAVCHRCVDTSSVLVTDPDAIIDGYQMAAKLPTGEPIGGLYNLLVNSVVHKNLTWAGGLADTPEFARLTSASLLNVTTLAVNETDTNGTYLAVTCVLYSCVRSYEASVHDGHLKERELPSIPAAVDLLSDPYRGTRRSVLEHLVGVKSPCVASGKLYSAQNMSTAPDVTQLSFCEPAGNGGPCQVRNVSAPEACIYRQQGRFTRAMRETLQVAFEGTCANRRGRLGCAGNGSGASFSSTGKWLFDIQAGTSNLVQDARSSFDRVDGRFRAFAAAVSARYRTSFGAQTFGLDGDQNPAAGLMGGEVAGRAWQTTSCNSAQLQWLALPATLTVATAALLGWAVAKSWARRRLQPVWKENLLPLVLYKDRLLLDAGDQPPAGECGSANGQRAGLPLMEVNELSDMASKIPVRFQWNRGPSEESGLRRRAAGSSDVDSLLQVSR